jgi:hypothetical protein
MDLIDKQVAPPKTWEKFEDLIRALFAAVWESTNTQKNGRNGQKQNGVDIYGTPGFALDKTFGVQCKGKNKGYGAKATVAEFNRELAKAENFKPLLGHWTFATTAPNDALLQEHARLVSEKRMKEGRFRVDVMGWETIIAEMSSHPKVIQEFYPEHAGDWPGIMAALRAHVEDLDHFWRNMKAFMPRPTAPNVETFAWSELKFETTRDLGPALMGRPLGPADVTACPTLPEANLLITDLERAGSARLAGVPGAGKSICVLQVARQVFDRGWRILRLSDPNGRLSFDTSPDPTLFIVDDAQNLPNPAFLRELEEGATTSRWVLSAFTIAESKSALPGTIHLDAKRAVRVIADGLRMTPETTLAAVRRADDRVGDRFLDERLDWRLDQAAKEAHYPWQFCFILGGGWRRASAVASSAREVGADLVLAAAAILQLATRDSRCSRDTLLRLLGDALPIGSIDGSINWLVEQRHLLADDDLRCPHQRLASVLLDYVLEGQVKEGRKTIARMFETVLGDNEMPLGGLSMLLRGLSTAGGHHRVWTWLVQPEHLAPVLARCWAATAPLDIRDACWVISTLHRYLSDHAGAIASQRDILVGWIEAAPEGACYAIGSVIGSVFGSDEPLGKSMVASVNPRALAHAISTASPMHAGEIADLITQMRAGENDAWKARYLENVDREACLRVVANWPRDAYLSVVADFCEHFSYYEPEYGFALIEALVPAIADRLRADPQEGFEEINDIVWNSLRLYDPLQIYVGKLAPTRRMLEVGRKICACWSPEDLAAKLSRSTQRTYQAAAGVLSFIQKASPKQFEATVLALDWEVIDRGIGTDWAESMDYARMLLGAAYALPAARTAIEALIERNELRIVTMSTHTAALAPGSALRHVAAGKRIALCHNGHVDWGLGALVLWRLVKSDPTLIPALLEPHYGDLAAALSQPSPSFYNEALLFLRLLAQVEPAGLTRVLDQIEVAQAGLGWRTALLEPENKRRRRGRKLQARQVAAFLIHHALDREDAVGDLARRLRGKHPRQSSPLPKTIETIDLTD